MANDLINGTGGGNTAAPAAEDRRVWKYRPGEAKLFDNPESVPADEGWGDVPVEAEAEPAPELPKRRGRPPKAEVIEEEVEPDEL